MAFEFLVGSASVVFTQLAVEAKWRSVHWGTEAWIQTHLLGYIAMLGLYILSRDSLERMYSPSIAMYPNKCVCIHASVPQWVSVTGPRAVNELRGPVIPGKRPSVFF